MGAQLQACGRICGASFDERPSERGAVAIEKKSSASQEETDAVKPEAPVAKPSKQYLADGDGEFCEPEDWDGRVKGTPVMDEGFICMGSRAPLCPAPPPKVMSGPITLSTLQGSWVNSSGAQIVVYGTDVNLNGMPLAAHKVTLFDDGTVSSIGSLWQLFGWTAEGGIEFKASSTKENMECARSEVWTRKDQADPGWSEKMSLLGYAGSAENPHGRGVEGCCPGTLGAELPFNEKKDREEVALLTALIQQWREPEIAKVLPRQVVPDFTNRAQTGLGVELVHFVATCIKEKGFQKRQGNQGHDIPVVVREPPDSVFYGEALNLWKSRVAEEDGFPPVRVGEGAELFSSLGNGHFFQALNLYDCGRSSINNKNLHYTVGNDADLKEALTQGVPSIVLKHATPKPVRAKIAGLLNSKRDFHWSLDADGTIDVSTMHSREDDKVSQFEWLSKGMDAHQVDCLVRTHLGIRDSHRIMG